MHTIHNPSRKPTLSAASYNLTLPLLLITALMLAGCGQQESSEAPPVLSDFVRINADGTPASGDQGYEEAPWSCVQDRFTGLMWEVKTDKPGLQFRENTYTWFKPLEEGHIKGDIGVTNGGICSESDCDTLAYVAAINERGLCGFHDWRLPERLEFGTTIDRRNLASPPTIDKHFFPNALASEYWSDSTYETYFHGAWTWNFVFGHDRVDWKKVPKHVRLVRGQIKEDLKKAVEERIEAQSKSRK